MTETLSLLGEKSNIADGEKTTRTTECCRSTDEEQDPARTSRSRSLATRLGPAKAVHGEHELRGGVRALQLRPVPGRQQWIRR